jgi:hypothetical protein
MIDVKSRKCLDCPKRPNYNYENEKGWQVKSKYFSGDVDEYINKSVEAMNK